MYLGTGIEYMLLKARCCVCIQGMQGWGQFVHPCGGMAVTWCLYTIFKYEWFRVSAVEGVVTGVHV